MPNRDYITVAELNYYINRIFDAEELLHNVPVVGEVSGCSIVKGNCYFTLKDEKAQIRVIYFNAEGHFIPNNGEKILVRGKIDYYQPNGQISLKAYEITRFGIGLMYAKLQQLKEKLTGEGLFREDHKKAIPKFPKNIGVITSVKGAAIQDIFSTLAKNNSKQNISVIDVRVQGENCVSDVVTALTYADSYGFDVILLARGGGSFEDLFPFNDERIVRAIYALQTPIITAIGHETDYTLVDFVSDFRAITPTAGAEKVAFNIKESYNNIAYLLREIKNLTIENYQYEKNKIINLMKDISYASNHTIEKGYNKVIDSCNMLKIKTEHFYDMRKAKLLNYITLLDKLNPTKLLEKGYFRILKDGKTINSFARTKIGSEIEIIGKKDKITAKVVKKEKI